MVINLKSFIVLCLIANRAFAEAPESIRDQMENQAFELLSGYDANALVVASIDRVAQPKVTLPGTPLLLNKDALLQGDQGQTEIGLTITINTVLKRLPDDLSDALKRAAKARGARLKLRILPPLAGFERKLREPTASPNPAPQPEKGAPIDFDRLLQFLAERFNTLTWIAGAIALAMVSIFAGLVLAGRQIARQSKVIANVASGLAQAIEAAGSPRSHQPSEERRQLADQGDRLPMLSGGNGSRFEELPDAGISALLADAYWSKQDGYAAFVWRRISTSRKQVLLGGLSFARDFVEYLSGSAEVDGPWDQHPYYLNPLPIDHLDNEAVAKLVMQQPGLLSLLPPMRVADLPVDSSDLLAIQPPSRGTRASNALDFAKVKSSPARLLNTAQKIVARSNEDDRKLMGLPSPTITQMRQVVSLAWATRLEISELRSVLKGFSASDLASCWIGPNDLIAVLASAVPELKLKMIHGYVEKVTPSRTSSSYAELHEAIVEAKARASDQEGQNVEIDHSSAA